MANEKEKVFKKEEVREKNEERKRQLIEKFLDNSIEKGTFIDERWSKENLSPKNAKSEKEYNGINKFMCTQYLISTGNEDNRFMTIKQINDEGYKVHKGSVGIPIKFWNNVDLEEKLKKDIEKEKKQEKPNKELIEKLEERLEVVSKKNIETGKKEMTGFYKNSIVFNVESINGDYIEKNPPKIPEINKNKDSDKHIPYIIEGIKKTSEVQIKEILIGQSFNSDKKGYITLPPRESFKNDKLYLATLLHEVAHSIKDKEARKEDSKEFGEKKAYAIEEITAEMTAGITLAMLDVDLTGLTKEENIFGTNKDYIENWVSVIKNEENISTIMESIIKNVDKRTNQIVEKFKEWEKEHSFEQFINSDKEIETDEKIDINADLVNDRIALNSISETLVVKTLFENAKVISEKVEDFDEINDEQEEYNDLNIEIIPFINQTEDNYSVKLDNLMENLKNGKDIEYKNLETTKKALHNSQLQLFQSTENLKTKDSYEKLAISLAMYEAISSKVIVLPDDENRNLDETEDLAFEMSNKISTMVEYMAENSKIENVKDTEVLINILYPEYNHINIAESENNFTVLKTSAEISAIIELNNRYEYAKEAGLMKEKSNAEYLKRVVEELKNIDENFKEIRNKIEVKTDTYSYSDYSIAKEFNKLYERIKINNLAMSEKTQFQEKEIEKEKTTNIDIEK